MKKLLSALFALMIVFALCSCGSSSNNDDSSQEAINTYNLEEMNISLSNLWTYRTSTEAEDDINCDDYRLSKEDDEDLIDYCIFYNSMDTENVYVCQALDNTEGPQTIEEFKEFYDKNYEGTSTEYMDFNGELAFAVQEDKEGYSVKDYAAIYDGVMYMIAHYYDPDYTDADEPNVLDGISFGKIKDSESAKAEGYPYSFEQMKTVLPGEWHTAKSDDEKEYIEENSQEGYGDTTAADYVFYGDSGFMEQTISTASFDPDAQAENIKEFGKLIESGVVNNDDFGTVFKGLIEREGDTYLSIISFEHDGKMYMAQIATMSEDDTKAIMNGYLENLSLK